MTVATFDVPFGFDVKIATRLPSRATGRADGAVPAARSNARKIRTWKVRRSDGTEGDAWRLEYLWDLTHGVLDMDFTDPESGDAVRVCFVSEPSRRRVNAARWEVEFELEEAL